MEQLQNLNQMDQTERAIVVGVWLRGQQDEQSAVTLWTNSANWSKLPVPLWWDRSSET